MKYFLIGFMGSGKSYIGKKICEKINLSHIDLDDYIAKHEHKSISNIFFENGEVYFREIEKQYLSKIINKDNFLLSTGGGTPIYNNNLDLMNLHGLTIYLRYSHKTLYNRLKNSRDKRPLIKDLSNSELKQFIKQELDKREETYNKAKVVIQEDTSINKIIRLLR